MEFALLCKSLLMGGSLEVDLQWRIFNYGVKTGDHGLLAELARYKGLDRQVDDALRGVKSATVRCAWAGRKGRKASELEVLMGQETQVEMLTCLCEYGVVSEKSLLRCAQIALAERSTDLARAVLLGGKLPAHLLPGLVTLAARGESFARYSTQLRNAVFVAHPELVNVALAEVGDPGGAAALLYSGVMVDEDVQLRLIRQLQIWTGEDDTEAVVDMVRGLVQVANLSPEARAGLCCFASEKAREDGALVCWSRWEELCGNPLVRARRQQARKTLAEEGDNIARLYQLLGEVQEDDSEENESLMVALMLNPQVKDDLLDAVVSGAWEQCVDVALEKCRDGVRLGEILVRSSKPEALRDHPLRETVIEVWTQSFAESGIWSGVALDVVMQYMSDDQLLRMPACGYKGRVPSQVAERMREELRWVAGDDACWEVFEQLIADGGTISLLEALEGARAVAGGTSSGRRGAMADGRRSRNRR